MTKFLKLTNARTFKPMLVNIARIREIEPTLNNRSIISFDGESFYEVAESMDTIILMIEREEVVK